MMAIAGRYIPVPNLDDRDWQTIRDEMIAKIPEKCPEWTDHNASDPGITLIELFALQIEELTYRLNQVLPKHKREYLNMIGVTLTPPSVATVDEFFKLSAKQVFDVIVAKGFEVSTGSGAGEDPLIYTTDSELTIHAATILKFFALQGIVYTDFTADANNSGTTFFPFAEPPTLAVDDAMYIAFYEDNYFEKLTITVETPATGLVGVWEYYRRNTDGTFEWVTLDVVDGTLDFTQSGDVVFTIPADWDDAEIDGFRATWLRYRITAGGATVLPELRLLEIDDILGRVPVSNAAQVDEEILGSSDGKIDQRFYLSNVPVLDITILIDEGAGFVAWQEADDLATSSATDTHYLLNKGTGEILFGDDVHGKVPAIGANNVKAMPYRYGGGVRGNVGTGTINQLRSSHVYIDSCTNKEPAAGGGDEETIDNAVARGPREQLKTRNRAVTEEDYDTLALESSTGISRAKALPLYYPSDPPDENKPGVVTVLLLASGGVVASQALKDEVEAYLDERRCVTAQLFVIDPEFVTIDITATIVKEVEAESVALQTKIVGTIVEFLDSEYGGDVRKAIDYIEGTSEERGTGWEFGRDVYLSELYELLEGIADVDHVDALSSPAATVAIGKIELPQSGTHTITIT